MAKGNGSDMLNAWPLVCHIRMKMKILANSRRMVNLYGRSRTARAKLGVSPSAVELACVCLASAEPETDAPQTAHCASPLPTMEPQLRHMVGRPAVLFGVCSLRKFLSKVT